MIGRATQEENRRRSLDELGTRKRQRHLQMHSTLNLARAAAAWEQAREPCRRALLDDISLARVAGLQIRQPLKAKNARRRGRP